MDVNCDIIHCFVKAECFCHCHVFFLKPDVMSTETVRLQAHTAGWLCLLLKTKVYKMNLSMNITEI